MVQFLRRWGGIFHHYFIYTLLYSQGKDRHPYPVGYVAHRTCNGNTYKMAILEGLKGPEFAVSG